jgi:hypothetical protein
MLTSATAMKRRPHRTCYDRTMGVIHPFLPGGLPRGGSGGFFPFRTDQGHHRLQDRGELCGDSLPRTTNHHRWATHPHKPRRHADLGRTYAPDEALTLRRRSHHSSATHGPHHRAFPASSAVPQCPRLNPRRPASASSVSTGAPRR